MPATRPCAVPVTTPVPRDAGQCHDDRLHTGVTLRREARFTTVSGGHQQRLFIALAPLAHRLGLEMAITEEQACLTMHTRAEALGMARRE